MAKTVQIMIPVELNMSPRLQAGTFPWPTATHCKPRKYVFVSLKDCAFKKMDFNNDTLRATLPCQHAWVIVVGYYTWYGAAEFIHFIRPLLTILFIFSCLPGYYYLFYLYFLGLFIIIYYWSIFFFFLPGIIPFWAPFLSCFELNYWIDIPGPAVIHVSS